MTSYDEETGEVFDDEDAEADAPSSPATVQPGVPLGYRRIAGGGLIPIARGAEPAHWEWRTAPTGERYRVPTEAPVKPARAHRRKAEGPSAPRVRSRWVVDEATGERHRVALTPEEIAAADAAKAAYEERRAEERRMLALLLPVHDDGLAPAMNERLVAGDARTLAGREVLALERPNGSKLRATIRHYDGTGVSGTRDIHYCSLHVLFAKPGSGLLFRTRGAMIERGEMLPVVTMFLREMSLVELRVAHEETGRLIAMRESEQAAKESA